MRISFAEEAGEAYQRLLGEIPDGYTVRVTTKARTFDAMFHRPDTDAGWYGAVIVTEYLDAEYSALRDSSVSVNADEIHVY